MPGWSQHLRKLIEDQSANAVVVSAFSILAMVGGAGLATDTIQWTLAKRQLQRMSDSAALSGAFTLARGADPTASVNAEIGRYTFLTLAGRTIETPPTAGPYAGNSRAVRVILDTEKRLPFSSMFFTETPRFRATATAAAVSFGSYCVISLENTAATGVTFQGSASVDLGCGISTNSQGTEAVYAGGAATVNASPVSAVGLVPASSNYSAGTVLNSYSIAQADPFASVALPSGYSCSGQLSVGPNQVRTVRNSGGGVQCFRGMDLKGTVNFDPGTYVIDGSTNGTLNVNSGAVVRCTGCTFIFTTTSSDMSTVATVKMNGNANWQVTAPETGPYAGIMFYQDRRAQAGSNSISGGSTSLMRGAIYFPSQHVQFTGNATMDTRCVQIVARNVTFIGNNSISNECPLNGASQAVAGTQIRLVD